MMVDQLQKMTDRVRALSVADAEAWKAYKEFWEQKRQKEKNEPESESMTFYDLWQLIRHELGLDNE